MTALDEVSEAFKTPWRLFFSFEQPLSVQYLATTFVLVSLYVLWQRRDRKEARLFSYLFPKKSFLHPSAMADYQFYIVGGIVVAALAGYVGFSSAWLYAHFLKGLVAVFGERQPLQAGAMTVVMETVIYLFFYDLGYWINHWLMHKVPWLWEIHKSHHSAEVLTPFTTLRTHPWEQLQGGNLIAVTTSVVYAVFTYLYGAAAHALELWQVNILLMTYYGTFHGLRHTHVWLPLSGPILGRLIQSPAHHQIHHSTSKKHLDKNFGFCLSFWDWVFGTLHIPEKEQEQFKLGIGKESAEYHGIMALLFLPFVKIWRRVWKVSKLKL